MTSLYSRQHNNILQQSIADCYKMQDGNCIPNQSGKVTMTHMMPTIQYKWRYFLVFLVKPKEPIRQRGSTVKELLQYAS